MRPHHGMCFQFYEGKGYSEDFTDHMGRIIREMEREPSLEIELLSKPDAVCENCPNNRSGSCATGEKSDRYDRMVLEYCGLKEGQRIAYGEFVALVKEKVIEAGVRREICGDCCWDEVCGKYRCC